MLQDVVNMKCYHVVFWIVMSISKNRSLCSRGGAEQASAEFGARLLAWRCFSTPFCCLFLSDYPWTQAELSRTAEVLWSTYHGQSPQTSAGWQSGVEWLAARDKLSREPTILNSLTYRIYKAGGGGNQSHSVPLNWSLYLSFSLPGSWQSNLAVNFLAGRECVCCYSDLRFSANNRLSSWLFLWAWATSVWTSSYPLQPSKVFPRGRAGEVGEGKLAIPCSHAPPRLEH